MTTSFKFSSLLALLLSFWLIGCSNEDAPADGHDHTVPALATSDDVLQVEGQTLYTCGMHPQIVESEPGYCPICAMELTPMRQGGGDGVVEIDAVTLQNIGVRTARVETRALGNTVRTTGRFEASERAETVVSPKISGWVEKLYVDYEGARVRRGQPLLEIYSPELVSTQEEYLLALRNAERLAGTSGADGAQRLVEAARRRLGYWDISKAQIDRLEASGQLTKTLTLYAPAGGTVTHKDVIEGQQVRAGESLMTLADLSSLWLMLDVNEQDLAWVERGTRAEIELPYATGAPLKGTVDYLYDTLDPELRTLKARVTVPNPGLKLKPGMYANARLFSDDAAPMPVVPEEAVIRTGEQNVVILALGNGRFQPVDVDLGLQAQGQVQILEGLIGGEQVVTSAQFLIDSEARLKSAVSSMVAGHTHGVMTGDGAVTTSMDTSVQTMLVDVHAADQNGDGMVNMCLDMPHLLQDTSGAIPDCGGTPEMTTVGAAQAILHESGYQNVPVDVALSDKNGDGIVYQSPMHWAVIKDAPGNCDICNMTLTRHTVSEARQNLIAQGYTVR